jgi:hypothetical protein
LLAALVVVLGRPEEEDEIAAPPPQLTVSRVRAVPAPQRPAVLATRHS